MSLRIGARRGWNAHRIDLANLHEECLAFIGMRKNRRAYIIF